MRVCNIRNMYIITDTEPVTCVVIIPENGKTVFSYCCLGNYWQEVIRFIYGGFTGLSAHVRSHGIEISQYNGVEPTLSLAEKRNNVFTYLFCMAIRTFSLLQGRFFSNRKF